MTNYKANTNDPDSLLSATLPKTTKIFIGADRKVMECNGPVIRGETVGDNKILDAVLFGLARAEKIGEAPPGLAQKFESVIVKGDRRAALQEPRLSPR
jgi:hypothetical protein